MVLVAFVGLSTPAAASVDDSLGAGQADVESLADGAGSGGAILAQNTYAFTFDTSDEGFTVEYPQTYSDVHWDSANRNVYLLSDRQDAGDEMFDKAIPTLDTTSDFTLTARWRATTQGNWQDAFPVFLTAAGTSDLSQANTMGVLYYSRDNHEVPRCTPYCTPYYYLIYRDASGTDRINTFYDAQVDTEYHFLIQYASSTRMLTMEVRDANDVGLKLAQYRIGTNPNDGFTLGKIGVASDGRPLQWEPPAVGWSDDLILTYATGSYRNVTEDLGDHTMKIGWLADNFNDNVKDAQWVQEGGSWTLSGGSSQFGTNTRIRTTAGQWDTNFSAKVTMTAGGSGTNSGRLLFRWNDASNYHYLDLNPKSGTLSLYKVVWGISTKIWSAKPSGGIAIGTPYLVKIDAKGGSFVIGWKGAILAQPTDPSSPAAGGIAAIGFATVGSTATMTVDDARAWTAMLGSVTTDMYQSSVSERITRIRTVHSGTAFNGVDILTQSSSDGITWGDWHYVKASAKSKTSDAEAYVIQDIDREVYARFRIDLRTTDDSSPALSAIVPSRNPIPNSPQTKILGSEPSQYYVGGMVNPFSFNVFLQDTDLSLPGKGWNLRFTRSYNSLNANSGPLGVGWTHSYNAFLTSGTGVVNYNDGDGTIHTFEDMGSGLYSPPRGLPGVKLVRNGDSTYAMSWKDGSRWAFSATGKLTQMADRNGNRLTLTYDAGGRLAKVADDTGIYLTLAYDSSGRIIRVSDFNGTTARWSPTSQGGAWTNGQNALSSNNLYASTKTNSAIHDFYNYHISGGTGVWVAKVETCVEAYAAGDDRIGVRLSTDGGASWSAEQVVTPPRADPNTATCVDFTSYKASWAWSDLSDASFRVQARYVKVGGQAGYVYLDWIPVQVTTAGRTVVYAYDASGRLSTVTDPLQASTLYMYSSQNTLEKYVDRADKVIRFARGGQYSPDELLVFAGRYNRAAGTILWQYLMYDMFWATSDHRLTVVYDALAGFSQIEIDTVVGVPIRVEGPLAALGGVPGCSCGGGCAGGGSSGATFWEMEWDGENQCVMKIDAYGHTVHTSYDWRGNVVKSTDALGYYTESTWQNRDSATAFDSLLLTQRNKRGFASQNEYDTKGNPVKAFDTLGNYTQNFFDSTGLVTQSRDKRGFSTFYGYSSHGWQTTVTDPLNHVTRTDYDAAGRRVKTTTALGIVSSSTYNGNDWVTGERNDLGFTTAYEYNGRGDRTAIVDANGNRTTIDVNVTCPQATKTTDPAGAVTENICDRLGRLVQVNDPNGEVWRTEYDQYGRKTRELDPNGFATRFWYDEVGNLVTRVDADGRQLDNSYDALNRVIRTQEDTNLLTYQYDAAGNGVQETGYGYTRIRTYDALDRVRSMTFDFGGFQKTVQYTYDESGNRKTMVYPDGFTVTYVWNGDGLLTGMQAAGQTWTFRYDADHRRTAAVQPNGLELNYTYDDASRLTASRTKKTADGSLVDGNSYTYDKMANRKTKTHENDNEQMSYDYQENYMLEDTTYSDATTASYFYDPNGNRLYRNYTSQREEYYYDLSSNLTGRRVYWSGTLRIVDYYWYDNAGNRIRWTNAIIGRGQTTYDYTYDDHGRLTSVSVAGYEITSYAYFVDGARIRKTEIGTPSYFLYDFKDFNGYEDILEQYDATGVVIARFIQGPGIDEPLAMQYGGSWYYYHFDGQGSVILLTRADQSVANRYEYDDFGAYLTRQEAVPNFYGYTGREYDSQVDLIYMRARYYDPSIGRFLSRDPLGMAQGPNLYTYAGNNPTSRTDPAGTWWFFPIGRWVYTGHVNCAGYQACVKAKVNYDPGMACLLFCGAAVAACIILISTVIFAEACPFLYVPCVLCWGAAFSNFSSQVIQCLLGNTYRWAWEWVWGAGIPLRVVCGG